MKFSAFMFQLILVSIVFTIAGNAFGQQSERPVIVASTTQIADFESCYASHNHQQQWFAVIHVLTDRKPKM
jgi:hypothetical protein